MEGEENFANLPLDDRKSWKARVSAYEDLTKLFQRASSPKDIIFRDRFEDMRKAPVELNAAALDAALAALAAYIENADCVSKLRPLVLPPLIEKGLGASRAGTKSKALEIVLEIVAADLGGPVVAELSAFLTHKQPKIIAVAINAMTEIVRNFGAANADPKQIIRILPSIFQHADKNVRSEGTALVAEMARWIGPSVSTGFEGLKPIKELQELIATIPAGQAKPVRYRRTEKCSKPMETITDAQLTSMIEQDSGSNLVAEILDVYSLSDPVNVLEKIPTGFYEAVDSSKWKDRKDALDGLLAVLKVPKIEDGYFGPLTSVLTKKVADVNVQVVISAAQCLEALGKGLRKHFSPSFKETVCALLDKCKEKNKNVLEALRNALDATVLSVSNVPDLVELISPYIIHKNPQVKAETVSWLARCIPTVCKPANAKKEAKSIVGAVFPALDDGALEVRDTAIEAIAQVIRIATEKTVLPFLEGLDKHKLAKILDISKSAAVENAATQSRPNSNQSSTVPITKVTSALQPVENLEQAIPSMKPKAASIPTITSPQRTNEESIELLRSVFGDEVAIGLIDANWKERLDASEKIHSRLEVIIPDQIDSEVLVQAFFLRPGSRESNLQVLATMILCVATLIKKSAISPEVAKHLAPILVEKIADHKLGCPVSDLLMSMAEQVSFGFVLECAHETIKATKTPKILTEWLTWISTAVLEFGIAGVDLMKEGDVLKSCMQSASLTVRTAAYKCAANICRFAGPEFRSMFSDIGSANLSAFDAEFAKIVSEPTPIPSRQKQIMSQPTTTPGTDGSVEKDTTMLVEEALPRQDLTNALSQVLPDLNNVNWKVRKEAMDKVQELLVKSSKRIRLSSFDVLNELKGRLNDSNKNLITQALELYALLAESIGSAFDKQVRSILSNIVSCLNDNKPQVRSAAANCLSAFVKVGSLNSMAFSCSQSLLQDSPTMRRELLIWLSENCLTLGKVNDEDKHQLLVSVASCLQDRNSDVRKASSNFVDAAIDSIGGDIILRVINANKPQLLPLVKQIVDAHTMKPASATSSVEWCKDSLAMPQTPQKNAPVGNARTPTKATTNEPTHSDGNDRLLLNADLNAKNARAETDTKHGMRWSIDSSRAELVEALKFHLNGLISSSVIRVLFSEDFKDHIAGLAALDEAIVKSVDRNLVIANSDVILKYLMIRLYDTNITVLIKIFDVLEHMLAVIDDSNLRLTEAEASTFLPHFVQRAGEMKEPIKGRVRGIYRQLCRVYPASKIFACLIESLKSKNSRARVESLNEMEVLISRNGLMVVQAAKHVPQIASVIGDRDSNVRNAALNVLVQIHELMGESLSKHLSTLCSKDIDLLNERIRRYKEKSSKAQEMDADNEQTEEAGIVQKDHYPENQNRAPQPDVPQVFSLDPRRIGSPLQADRVQLMAFATPIGPSGQFDSTPALPNLVNRFIAESESRKVEHPVDRIIAAINLSPDLECIQALQRLDDQLIQPNEIQLRIVPLINALAVRLHECAHAMTDLDSGLKSRLCRYVSNALVVLTANPQMMGNLDAETMQALTQEVLLAMVSNQIVEYEDKDQLLRTLNAVLVKALENAPSNSAYRALVALLEQSFRSPPLASDRFPEYVLKCLWKLAKQLPQNIQAGSLDISELLLDLHVFFCNLSPMEWKTRAVQKYPHEDLPLRTLKTILHELVMALGPSVLTHLNKVENPEQSFVTSYLRAMLAASNFNVSQVSLTSDTPQVQITSGSERLSEEEISSFLKDICSKICSKPNTRLGLNELHAFEKEHPYAVEFIDRYLEKLGTFFYKYIKRNLAQIEAEQSREVQTTESSVPIESYKNRLAQMQQHVFGRGGIVSDDGNRLVADDVAGSPVRTRLDSPVTQRIMSSKPATPAKDSAIISLKERLAKLRGQAADPDSLSPNS